MIGAIHETSDMFIEGISWPYWKLHERHGIGLPLVSMDFDFRKQVHGGDEVLIELDPVVGKSSVQFNYQATHEGELAFEGTEYRVCVPKGGDSGIAVPDDLREAMDTA